MRTRTAVVAAVALLLPAPSIGQEPARVEAPRPRPSALVETVGASLLLLDVQATDKAGRPLPGLKPEDFRVQLDGRAWPLQTLDDLCPHRAEPASPERPGPTEGAAAPGESAAALAASLDPVSYVLHLDFSELDMGQRGFATEAAKRWVREAMRPGDRVLATAYAGPSGFQVLAEWTQDKQRLVQAIDRADADPRMNDIFPSAYPSRVAECQTCCRPPQVCNCAFCWIQHARSEYFQQVGSLKALGLLLERLQTEPGRKVLMLFSAGTLFPSRRYPSPREYEVLAATDQIAAEATLARVTIHTALDTDLGVNLEDMTGVRRDQPFGSSEPACTYRLGLRPPERTDHVYRVQVEVRGRRLEGSHRVRRLSETEHWLRAARHVLRDPDRATDIPFTADLIPLSAGSGGWQLRVEVAVDPRTLELLRTGAGAQGHGRWEVGALLADERGRRAWEMLAVSELHAAAPAPNRLILHGRTIGPLRPGRYELRAFVRDRWNNQYGGARAAIDLPKPTGGRVSGPFLRLAESDHLRTSLPLLRERKAPEVQAEPGRGAVPLADRPVRAGEPLEFSTWICPGGPGYGQPQRWIELDGTPIFRFEAPETAPAGRCVVLRDRLNTSPMAPGFYAYHLRWDGASDLEQGTASRSFEIAEAP